MKTTILSALALVAAASGLTACENAFIEVSDEVEIDLKMTQQCSSSPVFQANISENCSHNYSGKHCVGSTPKADGGYSQYWEAGDEISITDGTSSAIYHTEQGGNSVLFTQKTGYISSTATAYRAFYPASLNPQNLELPRVQEYVQDGVRNFPMYAEACGGQLSFRNLCGIFRLSIKNEDSGCPVRVKSISVLADGRGLAGHFSIDSTGAAVVCGTNGVTLSCCTPVLLSACTARDFNIIIPKGDYCSLKIKITTDTGRVINLRSESPITIRRSGITRACITLKPASFDGGLEDITFSESDAEFSK